jgi:NAD(P)H-hydrate epimerase
MPIPVINLAQMREWESLTWAAGQTDEGEVIRRVGHALAQSALQLTRAGDAILILAGKGHNGDDARAAKEFLTDRKIILLNATDPEAALDEFLQHTARNDNGTGLQPFSDAEDVCPALIIDGLFGIGLDRLLADGWKKLIAAVNGSKIRVLAVDIPSGLNAETGEHFGAAIEAVVTLTVGAPKIGLLAQPAWPFVGQLQIAGEVGLVPCPLTSELNWTLPEDFADFPPSRAVAGNKGTFGHTAIIAGSLGFHGAGVLTARAAQRAQPGLVTLFTQADVYPAVAAQLAAVMVNVWSPELKLPAKTSALLIGPGLAAPELPDALKATVRQLWNESPLPLVVDASAFDWLTPSASLPNALRVLTPHPGEAARLLGQTVPAVQADRPAALREISRRFGGCWVVLKGHQTLVGRADGEIFVNPSGNPHLAQGGSGDVLAGFLTGLLAQPALQADAGKTIRYAVWQHGAAADELQARRANWVVEDLVAELGNVDGFPASR